MQAKKIKSAAEGGTNRHFIVPRDYQSGEGTAINWSSNQLTMIS